MSIASAPCGALAARPDWHIGTATRSGEPRPSTRPAVEGRETAAREQRQADPDHPGPLELRNGRQQEEQGGNDAEPVGELHWCSFRAASEWRSAQVAHAAREAAAWRGSTLTGIGDVGFGERHFRILLAAAFGGVHGAV